MREIEARLNELFDWANFEKDIVPQLGPTTALLVKRPVILAGKPLYPPSLALLLALDRELDLQKPLKKLWQLVQKKAKVARHLKAEEKTVQESTVHVFNFVDTPIDGLVSPSLAFPSGWLAIASHDSTIAEIISLLRHPKSNAAGNTYFYANFRVLGELLQANKPFLKKQAKKKGKPFSEEKAEHFMRLLRFFEYLELSGKTTENRDIFELVLQLNK